MSPVDSRTQRHAHRISLQNIRFDRATAVLAILSAALGIGAGVLGVMAANLDRENASLTSDRASLISAKEELEQQLVTANAEVAARDETIAALRDENRTLRALAPYTVAPQDIHDIRAHATVTLATSGDTVDLNSIAPDFGASTANVSTDNARYKDGEIRFGYGVSSLTLAAGTANYETCAATTGYPQTSSIEARQLKDPRIRLRLQSGRYVAVHVTAFDENSAVVTFTVWE